MPQRVKKEPRAKNEYGASLKALASNSDRAFRAWIRGLARLTITIALKATTDAMMRTVHLNPCFVIEV
jgi:hypothetical protein